MSWRCPKLGDIPIIADDPQLAAQLVCQFARPGEYVPLIDGPRLTRPDADAEVIRRNNAVARTEPNLIVAAGVADESYRRLSQKFPSSLLRRVQSPADFTSLPTRRVMSEPPLRWGKNKIGLGLLNALRSGRSIEFSDDVSSSEQIGSLSGHLVVCEEGNDLAQVIAANYAYSLRAGLALIPEPGQGVGESILQRFYGSDQDRYASQSSIFESLRDEMRRLVGSVALPDNGSITFVTGDIPYGFAFPELPSTHLFKYPDLGIAIVNGFSAEQEGSRGINVAVSINPQTVEARELRLAEDFFVPKGALFREYRGRQATVQRISEMIEFFPYDFLMIATHCGDASGYRWTYEFTDSEGLRRTLVVDIAVGIGRTSDKDMLDVVQFTNFVSLDGVDWSDPEKDKKLNVGSAILDYVERTRDGGDLEPVKRETIPRVVWSSALKMYDNNYIALPRPVASGRTPIVVNNACGSWHRLASDFMFGNVRAYIGTLFPISTSEVEEVMRYLLVREFQKPLAIALWAAQRRVYGKGNRRPYVAMGVFTQWLRVTRRDVPADIQARLKTAYREWQGFLSQKNPGDKMYNAIKDVVEYHERELARIEETMRRK